MLPVINIGPLALQTNLFLSILGVYIAWTLVEKYSITHQIEAEKISNLILYTLIAGMIGARVFFFIDYPDAFRDKPIQLLSPNPNLFLAEGGLLAGGIVFLILIQRWKLNFWQVMDCVSPGLAVFFIFWATSRLASGVGYGLPSNLPWAIQILGDKRHPTQVYELMLFSLIFIRLIGSLRRTYGQKREGVLFLEFLIWGLVGEIVIESFRVPVAIESGSIRTIQILLWGFLAICLYFYDRKNQPFPEKERG